MPRNGTPLRPFGSVLTAMVTPFDDAGALDIDAAVRVALHLVEHGHDGIVLNGTTGESPTTHADEKFELVRAVVDAVGARASIVAGAGSNDTAHALRMAEGAAQAGAHGLLVVSPYYNRPSQQGLVAHFTALAEATDLPVMLYDIPGRCGVAIGDEAIDELAEHPRVVAVKDATGNVAQGFARLQRTGLAWYSGDDPLNLAFLALGAVGVVSVAGHVTGDDLAGLVRAVDDGDLAQARALQARMAPVVTAIMGTGQGASLAKAAIQAIGLTSGRATRLPVTPASDQEFAALSAVLADYAQAEVSA